MKRVIAIVAVMLNLMSRHVLAAYDPEYGDAYSTLPIMTVLNPLEGTLIITSEFSLVGRMHPVFGSVRPHKGTDLAANMGDNIYVSLNGTVTYSGWAEGYGNVVYILLKVDGYTVETRYAHCSALLVSTGNEVSAGTINDRHSDKCKYVRAGRGKRRKFVFNVNVQNYSLHLADIFSFELGRQRREFSKKNVHGIWRVDYGSERQGGNASNIRPNGHSVKRGSYNRADLQRTFQDTRRARFNDESNVMDTVTLLRSHTNNLLFRNSSANKRENMRQNWRRNGSR